MENRINIGELDTLVTLLKMTQSRGAQGAKAWTVTDTKKVYAKIENTVSEMVGDGNLEAQSTVELSIYKFNDLTSRWRVRIGEKNYEIVSIDPVSRVSPLCILSLRTIDY